MKKYKFTLITLCVFFFLLVAQTVQAQRYLPGQTGIQLTGGITNGNLDFSNYHVGIAFSKYTQKGNRWLYGAEFFNIQNSYNKIRIPANQFTGEVGYYINFLSDKRKNIFLSVGGSALGGYETINWGKKELPDGAVIVSRDHFIYGGALTLELEGYLTDRVAILLNVRERVLWGSDRGHFQNQIGVGLKYILK